MKYLELSRGVKIKRCGHGGEEKIGKFKIDGTLIKMAKRYYVNMLGVFGTGIQNVLMEKWKIPKITEQWVNYTVNLWIRLESCGDV